MKTNKLPALLLAVLISFFLLNINLPADAQQRNPHYRVEPPELNLSIIKKGQSVHRVVEIYSTDDESVLISPPITDCKCLTARILSPRTGPGKPAKIVVSYAADTITPLIRNMITIRTNHPEPRGKTIHIPVYGSVVAGAPEPAREPEPDKIDADSSAGDDALEVGVVYSSACSSCARSINKVKEVKKAFGDRIKIFAWDTAGGNIENLEKSGELIKAYNLGADSNESVYVYVGERALAGEKAVIGELEETIKGLIDLKNPDRKRLRIHLSGYDKKESDDKASSLGIIGIITGGLADGVNPCAFAVIIFFISLMNVFKKSKRDILITGTIYTSAVFVTYYLIGVGLFNFLRAMEEYYIASLVLFYILVGLTILFGLLSIYDAVIYKVTGQSKAILLQLPMWLKKKIHNVMRENLRTASLVTGSIVIGAIVALLEFPCTGQLYLPTIKIMIAYKDISGYLYLLLYNIMFIIPLIAVFIATYYGVQSEKLVQLAQKHLVTTKILLAIVFFALAAILFWGGKPEQKSVIAADPSKTAPVKKNNIDEAAPPENDKPESITPASSLEKPEAIILFTTDSHAQLFPCNCPIQQTGGIARRATLIEQIRGSSECPVLLVDGGGSVPSMPYFGEELDKERTDILFHAMNFMKYDAVNIGASELFFGQDFLLNSIKKWNLPAFNTNIIDSDTKVPFFPKWKILKAGARKIAFLGINSPSFFAGNVSKANMLGLKAADPVKAVEDSIAELRNSEKPDAIILFAFMLESEFKAFTKQISGADIMMNAYPSSTENSYRQKGMLIIPAIYESRSLGKIELAWKNGKIEAAASKIELGPAIKDQPEVAAMVETMKKKESEMRQGPTDLRFVTSGKDEQSLYVIRECLLPLMKEMGSNLRVDFFYALETDENGRPYSPAGEDTLNEIKRQLAVQRNYPGKFAAYLTWLTREKNTPWKDKADSLKIDMKKIDSYMAGREMDSLLAAQSEYYMRTGSPIPSVITNGIEFTGDITDRCQILKFLCRFSGDAKYPTCSALPICCTAKDCYKKGYHAECFNPGRSDAACVHTPGVKVPVIVLYDKDAYFSKQKFIEEITEEDFPGAEFVQIEYNSEKGREYVKRYNIRVLPALIFDPAIEDARNFKKLQASGVLYKEQDAYMYARRGVIPSNEIIVRPAKQDSLDLFVNPYSAFGIMTLAGFIEELTRPKSNKSEEINIRFIAVKNEAGTILPGLGTSTNPTAALEEIKYHLAVLLFHPKKYFDFARKRAANPGSLKWYKAARDAGLDPDTIEKESASPEVLKRLEEDIALLEAINNDVVVGNRHAEDIIILLNNREVLPCVNIDTPGNILRTIRRAKNFNSEGKLPDISTP